MSLRDNLMKNKRWIKVRQTQQRRERGELPLFKLQAFDKIEIREESYFTKEYVYCKVVGFTLNPDTYLSLWGYLIAQQGFGYKTPRQGNEDHLVINDTN